MFLEVENLQAGYGTEEVLHGVSLRVDEGEIVSILGANGAGKTTTLLTISGLVRASGGAVRFQGEDLHTLPSHEVVRRGLTQSPEGRRVFGVLTVLENLRLGAFTVGDKEKAEQTLDWIFDLFPRLHERKDQLAGTLSGGEQQMLAIGRALMGQPKLLLLDEPSLGLAPLLVKSIFETIRAINQSGVTILIVEQNARAALKLATRGYVLELGRVVMVGRVRSVGRVRLDLEHAFHFADANIAHIEGVERIGFGRAVAGVDAKLDRAAAQLSHRRMGGAVAADGGVAERLDRLCHAARKRLQARRTGTRKLERGHGHVGGRRVIIGA